MSRSSIGLHPLYLSSVGSAPTQRTQSTTTTAPCSTQHPSDEAYTSEASSSLLYEEAWISSFLTEVKSILPYRAPDLHSTGLVSTVQCGWDWETLLGEISRPLVTVIQQWAEHEMKQMWKSLRLVCRAFRRAFGYEVEKLTVSSCHIKKIVQSIQRWFGNLTTLHIHHHEGHIHRSLRHCTQLRNLSIEPVNLGFSHEHEAAVFSHLTNLEVLRLWGPVGITSKGMESLLSLTLLTSLSLGSMLLIQGADLIQLSRSTRLQTLELKGCHSMDDRGLEYLAYLTQLKELKISISSSCPTSFCRVSPRGFAHLSQLPHLSSLQLIHFETCGSQHLQSLSMAISLKELSLNFPRAVSSMDLSPLGCLHGLISLTLCGILLIDDQNIQICKKLTQLQILKIGNCSLATDSSAHVIARLPYLTYLRIEEYPLLTEIGLESLMSIPTLMTMKITGIYSISGDEAQDLTLNNNFSLDSESWRQQTLHIQKIKISLQSFS